MEVFVHKQNVYIAYEFMDYDLEIVIKDPTIHLSPESVKSYMKMLIHGIEHLHSRWILHRVIKKKYRSNC